MRSPPWIVALALAGAACSYVKSAVRERLDADGAAARSESLAVGPADSTAGPQVVVDLADERFSPERVEQGYFDPRAFLERTPALIYALEAPDPARTPVIFVHGMRGGARDFDVLAAALDRRVYQPFFFHYPSGEELGPLSDAFYRLFLSGQVLRSERPLVLVAHSMGGLVVRNALNRCSGAPGENRVARLVTVASPMGGLSTAFGAADSPPVIRAWRDLDPHGPFMERLYRRPLPPGVAYHLFFTFADRRAVKVGETSDGVVPLASQLAPAAQDEATTRFGLDATHDGVLRSRDAVRRILGAVEDRTAVAGTP
jgi:pimeloyl-ACP methyl ester carboxylesterase